MLARRVLARLGALRPVPCIPVHFRAATGGALHPAAVHEIRADRRFVLKQPEFRTEVVPLVLFVSLGAAMAVFTGVYNLMCPEVVLTRHRRVTGGNVNLEEEEQETKRAAEWALDEFPLRRVSKVSHQTTREALEDLTAVPEAERAATHKAKIALPPVEPRKPPQDIPPAPL